MSGQPSFPWYPGDWKRDTAMLSLEQKGAWCELIQAMHDSQTAYGRLCLSWREYSRLIGADSSEHAQEVICRLVELRICDAHDEHGNVTCHGQSLKSHGQVTLICRRMDRQRKEREKGKLRKRRQRARDDVTGESLAFPPAPSFSSSFSPSGEEQESSLRSDSSPEPPAAASGAMPSPQGQKVAQDTTRDGGSDDPPSPVVLRVPLVKRDGEYGITQAEVDSWQEDFPGIDVMGELRALRQWNLANPRNRKTRTGFKRHVVSWLSRAQNRSRPSPRGEQPAAAASWDRRL